MPQGQGHKLPLDSFNYPLALDDDDERRAFHYFRSRTASQLSGYFSMQLWDCLIPLSSQYHPAVKHAVVALAAMHERFEKDDRSVLSSNHDISQGGFALQHYNRAIRHLTKSVLSNREESLDVFLVACILFACFEVLTSLDSVTSLLPSFVMLMKSGASRPLRLCTLSRSQWY